MASRDPDQLRARREAQRHNRAQARRRAAIALGAAVLAVAAVVVVAALAGSDSKGDGAGSTGPAATTAGGSNQAPAGDKGSTLVRNATPQPDWEPHTGPVPILEYHVLGAPAADAPYPELYVSRPDFHQQMEWLDRHGYQAVTLEQVEGAWYDGGTLPAKPVVLSFDDGYRPQFTYALPELRKHGWPGVLNLKAEGSDLYESNVKAMVAAGWELAAHTIDHSDLTTLDAEGLKRETAGAREILRRDYGVPVRDEAPYELTRFEILGSSGVAGLADDLASG